MPYAYSQGDNYVGDYYEGDYYQGDPGIGSALARIGKGIISKVVPFGGIVSTAAELAVGGLKKRGATLHDVLRYGPSKAVAIADVRKGRMMAEAAPPPGAMLAPPELAMMGLPAGIHGMRRTHLNKATYYRRGGGTQNRTPGLVLKGTEFVPNRRTNVANPRALRRALRRIQGFGKIVKRMKRAVARANSAVGNVHRGGRKALARRR